VAGWLSNSVEEMFARYGTGIAIMNVRCLKALKEKGSVVKFSIMKTDWSLENRKIFPGYKNRRV
jgi:hypothetical protein